MGTLYCKVIYCVIAVSPECIQQGIPSSSSHIPGRHLSELTYLCARSPQMGVVSQLQVASTKLGLQDVHQHVTSAGRVKATPAVVCPLAWSEHNVMCNAWQYTQKKPTEGMCYGNVINATLFVLGNRWQSPWWLLFQRDYCLAKPWLKGFCRYSWECGEAK